MQNRKGLLFLLFFSALVSLISFSSAQVFNSTNQNITSCGNITEPGLYYVNQSLNSENMTGFENDLEGYNSCINIHSSNVFVNCLGNSLINYTAAYRTFSIKNQSNITLISCTIGLNDSIGNYGIYLTGVRDLNISNINIINGYYGIYAINSTTTNYTSINLSSNFAGGISLQNSSNNIMKNLILSSSSPAIYLNSSTLNYLYNTNLSSVTGEAEILSNYSSINLINVTNDQSKEKIDSNSSLLRGWYISFNITNSSGVGLYSSARFSNRTSNLVYSGFSNVNGTGYGEAVEYLFNSTDRIYYSNYTLNFVSDGYSTNTSIFNLTQNSLVTITVHDFISPVVTLNSPVDDEQFTGDSYEVPIRYRVIENVSGIRNCTVHVDSSKYLNTSAVSTSAQNTYYKTLDEGSYNIYVKCTDSLNNIGTSSTSTILIEDDSDGGSSGGGSGGGSSDDDDDDDEEFWTNIYSPTSGQLQNGSNWALKQGERVKVSVNKITHYVGIISVTSSQVKINVSSKPQQNTLRIGDIWNVDVDGNGNLDISVKLGGINGTKANITITTLNSTSQTYTLVSGLNNSVVSANLTEVDTEPSTFSRVWGWTKDSTRGVFSRIFGNIIFKGIVVILIGILVGAVSMFLYLRKKKNKRIRGY